MSPAVKKHRLGFRQLDPVPSSDELNEFYQSKYYDLLRKGGRAPELRKLLDVGGERNDELAWLSATLYVDVATAIREHAPQAGKVLDVGCGAGEFVGWLAEQGFEASGLDPSTDAVSVATSRGINASCATLEEWAGQPGNAGQYGAITLMNVLEHVPDPLAVLRCIGTLLAPGGILVFRVPNDFTAMQEAAAAVTERQGWWIASPDHINYFKADTARAACAEAGLEVVDVTADFPMEFFILMGVNYVDVAEDGRRAHQMRRQFEMNMPTSMRQKLYKMFAEQGLGRNILVTAKRV